MAAQAGEERPLFQETFRNFPMENITKLNTYALALWQAETEYRQRQVEEETLKTPPADLVDACRETRDGLVAAAQYVFRNDKKASEVLADITRSTGYQDLADDLNRLARLFNVHWRQVNGNSEVRKDDLDRAEHLGARLMNIVSLETSPGLAEWTEKRQQAWTLLHRAYQEVRDAAAYIHRAAPDKLAAYPSVFATGD